MENKTNTGAAFKNDYKKEDKHPDWKGTVNIDGKEKAIALWEREKNGKKYYSIAFSEPYKKPSGHEGLPQTKKESVSDPDVLGSYNNDSDLLPF